MKTNLVCSSSAKCDVARGVIKSQSQYTTPESEHRDFVLFLTDPVILCSLFQAQTMSHS